MTVILKTLQHGKSKASLLKALNEEPENVVFEDPSPFRDKIFTAARMKEWGNFSMPVVMDHPKRLRFAQVSITAQGKWSVK
jgi:hypothetical protein